MELRIAAAMNGLGELSVRPSTVNWSKKSAFKS